MLYLLPVWIEGHQLIPLSQLPIDQAAKLSDLVGKEQIKNIAIGNNQTEPCVTYDVYAYWKGMLKFENNLSDPLWEF
jgi:hypothetical protein